MLLDRNLYKTIKKMNRDELERTLQSVYHSGFEEGQGKAIDMDELRQALGQINGIGEKRLDEIMRVIEEKTKESDPR